jgi:hypothetical protein
LGSITLGPRPFLDRTLLVYLDAGEVAALDSNDKDVWRIRKVDFPLDAEPLQGNRVLLAENQGGRVCIRSHTGRILWQYAVESPIVAQALPGGKTFIATRSDLFVIDRLGNRVREWKRPRGEVIMRASALPDGGLALINMRQRFMRLDAAGEVVESFPVMVSTTGGRVDVAPDGRVLIPMMHQDLVLEMNSKSQPSPPVETVFSSARPLAMPRIASMEPSVTMNGPALSLEVKTPFSNPQKTPVTAHAMTAAKGLWVRLKVRAPTTEARAMTLPALRSMPPATITYVIPTAPIPIIVD